MTSFSKSIAVAVLALQACPTTEASSVTSRLLRNLPTLERRRLAGPAKVQDWVIEAKHSIKGARPEKGAPVDNTMSCNNSSGTTPKRLLPKRNNTEEEHVTFMDSCKRAGMIVKNHTICRRRAEEKLKQDKPKSVVFDAKSKAHQELVERFNPLSSRKHVDGKQGQLSTCTTRTRNNVSMFGPLRKNEDLRDNLPENEPLEDNPVVEYEVLRAAICPFAVTCLGAVTAGCLFASGNTAAGAYATMFALPFIMILICLGFAYCGNKAIGKPALLSIVVGSAITGVGSSVGLLYLVKSASPTITDFQFVGIALGVFLVGFISLFCYYHFDRCMKLRK